MKLQKQLSRKYQGKAYPKYLMTIPPDCIEKLGWQQGSELEVAIKNNKLIVQPKTKEAKE